VQCNMVDALEHNLLLASKDSFSDLGLQPCSTM
jgi:hypothetical protein